jgi:hypothetical protein
MHCSNPHQSNSLISPRRILLAVAGFLLHFVELPHIFTIHKIVVQWQSLLVVSLWGSYYISYIHIWFLLKSVKISDLICVSTTDSWDKAFGLVVPHSCKNKSLIKVENHLHVYEEIVHVRGNNACRRGQHIGERMRTKRCRRVYIVILECCVVLWSCILFVYLGIWDIYLSWSHEITAHNMELQQWD